MDTHYFLQDAQGAYHPINGPTVIGRDPACQIRLADPEVSRNHALLWVERKTLYIRDESTRNGTYLNELSIPPNQAIALSTGSQLRLGNTFFTVVTIPPAPNAEPVAVPAPVPASISTPQRPSKLPFFLILLLGGLCLGFLALAAGYLLFRPRAAQATPETFPGMTVLATSQPQPLLAPKEFADASKTLALSVARLNTAELVFIKQAQATSPVPKTMDDALREVTNGTLTGGGSSIRSGLVCGAMKFDVTCNASYTGSFSGAVDPASGALSMGGNVSGSQSCTFSNCSQEGVEFACSPGSSTIADSLTITGTVIQSSGAGSGAIQTCAGCSGDWSAGK